MTKTIKLILGIYKTKEKLFDALKKNDVNVSAWARELMDSSSFTLAGKKAKLEVVILSIKELGFSNGVTRKEIYEKALEQGYELCPAEVGPQLRLQYKDQPNGEYLLIAMEPIAGSDGSLDVFNVGRDADSLWLYGLSGRPGSGWNAESRWVFLRRKSFELSEPSTPQTLSPLPDTLTINGYTYERR